MQIDLIAVTSKGFLVIEKETMIGLILGDEYQKFWTIYLRRGKEKHQLKNPLHQNFGHIKVLEELFPQYSAYYKNVVIFSDNAKLGDKLPKNVMNDRDFLKGTSKVLQHSSKHNRQVAAGDIHKTHPGARQRQEKIKTQAQDEKKGSLNAATPTIDGFVVTFRYSP